MNKMIAICLAASAAVLAVTPLAGGHSTVSLLQPQGKVLTSARAAYVLRAPNEKAKQDTIMVTMHVPEAVQTSISVKQTPDWSVVLKRRATGQVDAEGNPRFAIERVSWIAKNGQGHARRARFLRRVVVPDAEPGDAAAALLLRSTSGTRRRRPTGSPRSSSGAVPPTARRRRPASTW